MAEPVGGALREIAGELRQLVSTSPVRSEDVESWDAVARKAYDRLSGKFPDVVLPHFVMHYVHDADVRARDAGYRAEQARQMESLIGELERGVLPADQEREVSPALAGTLVLAVLVGAALLVYQACR